MAFDRRSTHADGYLGKASKNQVLFVFLNTTLRPDISGEWSITAPTS